MKKFLLVALLALGLIACSKEEEMPAEAPAVEASAPAAEEASAPAAEAASAPEASAVAASEASAAQ